MPAGPLSIPTEPFSRAGRALAHAMMNLAVPSGHSEEQDPERDEEDWVIINTDLSSTSGWSETYSDFEGASYFEDIDRAAAERNAAPDNRGLKSILNPKPRKAFTKAKEGLKKLLKAESDSK